MQYSFGRIFKTMFLLAAVTAALPGAYAVDLNNPRCNELTVFDNPFRYCDYQYDSELELYFCKSRYYCPSTGGFISRDTSDVSNRYAYCNGQPVMESDGEGHMGELAFSKTIHSPLTTEGCRELFFERTQVSPLHTSKDELPSYSNFKNNFKYKPLINIMPVKQYYCCATVSLNFCSIHNQTHEANAAIFREWLEGNTDKCPVHNLCSCRISDLTIEQVESTIYALYGDVDVITRYRGRNVTSLTGDELAKIDNSIAFIYPRNKEYSHVSYLYHGYWHECKCEEREPGVYWHVAFPCLTKQMDENYILGKIFKPGNY